MKINPGLAPLLRNVTALEPDPRNTRRHSPDQIAQIAAWLQTHGQQKPIVVDENDRVIAGNGVFLGARQLGWAQVAALTYQGPNPRAFSIIDNRSAELSEWDVEALASELEAFEGDALLGLGFAVQDLEELGVDLEALHVNLEAAAGLAEGVDGKKRTREDPDPTRQHGPVIQVCPKCGGRFQA